MKRVIQIDLFIFGLLTQFSIIILFSTYKQSKMLSLSLYNMIRQQTNQSFTNKTFKAYYCGCGLIFQDPQQFKQHVLVMHNGVFVPQSSHFLAFLSKAVLPCKLWDPSVIDKQQDKHQGHSTQRENIRSMSADKNTSNKRPKAQTPHNQFRKNYQDEQGKQEEVKQEKENQNLNLAQKTAQKSQKNIICNGFVLQANKRTKLRSFYCGKCKVAFENAQDFLDHCFEACQQLQHPESSHHIKQAQVKEIKQPQASEIKTVNHLMIRPSSVPGMIQVGVRNRQHFIQIPSTMLKMFDLLRCSRVNLQLKKSSFVCGCGLQVKYGRLAIIHLRAAHQQIVPLNSSHILLQRGQDMPGREWQFRMMSVSDPEDSDGWCCPCQVQISMKRSAFVKHVQQKHKGITPVYNFPPFTVIKQ